MESELRLWLLALALMWLGMTPLSVDMYFPNTAQIAIQTYLSEQIYPNSSTEQEETLKVELLWSLFISESQIGTFLAAFLGPWLVDSLGRTNGMSVALILGAAGHLSQFLAQFPPLWPMLYTGRFVLTMGMQLFSICFPIFLVEVSSSKNRGRMGSLSPTGSLSGTLIAAILGLAEICGTSRRWPYAYLGCFVFSLIPIFLCFWLQDTPVFLAADGRSAAARKALRFYRGKDRIEEGLACATKDAASKTRNKETVKHYAGAFCRLWQSEPMRKPATIAVVVVIAYAPSRLFNSYSTAIFVRAGLDNRVSTFLSLGMMITSVVAFVLCFLTVDLVGRRVLMLTGTLGGGVCWLGMTGCQAIFDQTASTKATMAFCVLAFGAQLFINLGVKPVFWFLIPEILPFSFRSIGKSFSICVMGLYGFILLLVYYLILSNVAPAAHAIVAASLLAAFVFLYLNLPESKGKAPHEIFPEYLTLGIQLSPNESVDADIISICSQKPQVSS